MHTHKVPDISSRAWKAAVLLTAAFCVGLADAARAHDPGLSSLELHVTSSRIAATLSLAAADARLVLDEGHGRLDTLALEAIELRIDGLRLRAVVEGRPVSNDAGAAIHVTFDRVTGSHLTVRSRVPRRLAFGHRELLTVLDAEGRLLADRMLDAQADELAIDLDRAQQDRGTAVQFFALGIRHILGGYDHLLFLGALLLRVRRWQEVVKTVTAFTVAHSVTLALAVLGFVRAPGGIVEPLIAASIVFVGLENLLRGQVDSRWKVTFAFGLVHGFGFAGALQELGVGTHSIDVAAPLASFNVGVEIGQVAVAMLLWPVIRWLNAQAARRVLLAPACSLLVVAAGAYWLIQRTIS